MFLGHLLWGEVSIPEQQIKSFSNFLEQALIGAYANRQVVGGQWHNHTGHFGSQVLKWLVHQTKLHESLLKEKLDVVVDESAK